MNTPSPNSMKRDPGRGSAYLSFLKKRYRDFFFFCLLLGVYVAFITLTGIGCPIRFSTGISCPGCGMSRAVLLMLSGLFQALFGCIRSSIAVTRPRGYSGPSFRSGDRNEDRVPGNRFGLTVLKKGYVRYGRRCRRRRPFVRTVYVARTVVP